MADGLTNPYVTIGKPGGSPHRITNDLHLGRQLGLRVEVLPVTSSAPRPALLTGRHHTI
jgi:hypothetical protein